MEKSSFGRQYKGIFPALLICLLIVLICSMRFGAVNISWETIYTSLQKCFSADETMNLNERIFMQIRFPRAVLCLFVGASLGVGGALMQALFRNPIVEPGLVGTSSGAAFGAALYFVLGGIFKFNAGEWTLPLVACFCAGLATFLVFLLSKTKHSSKSSIIVLLLVGIAVNALFMSGVGFMSYIARDPQARSITFWNMGTLSGANWNSVLIIGISTVVSISIAVRYSKHLNALLIGEEEAQFLGVNVKRLKFIVLLLNVILVAVATAFTGVIAFVGLIVPHLLRILSGSDNRYLILGSALMGGIVLSIADLVARLVLAPAELPIGIVMSVVGAPVFIYLLRKKNYYF
ncbi:MAG: iron ABC transporter permease [Sphingobacteriales bacterium]|nr:MAG: iron ABC transporter permease [Sphingobacteriales bacterium]